MMAEWQGHQRSALLCSGHHWRAEIQVGTHHFARQLIRRGWQVDFLSAPVTPFHLAGVRHSQDHRRRFATWWQHGCADLDTNLYPYTPLTLLPLSSVLGLRYDFVLRNWQHATVPRLSGYLRRRGPDWKPDLLMVDTALFSFIFDWIQPLRSVFRIADYNPAFASATPQLTRIEREGVGKADLAVYTAPLLADYVATLSPRRSIFIPNGVDLSHYRQSALDPPREYSLIPAPRAVYVGALRQWFDYDLVNRLAAAMPNLSFVIIGADHSGGRFTTAPNLHLLGQRPYSDLPAYLQAADVGIIPFDRDNHAALVDQVNPLKLYEYVACGLPVVSTAWHTLRQVASPAILCETFDQWVNGLTLAIADRKEIGRQSSQFAEGCDWSGRLDQLLAAADL